ncbi:hypothetical protein T484DRAFT_3641700 [Baffinella frigidus]|nr:hypothetical protein T484DRAFT_3641700 [Cryptophyta sp. CCMP2293]
MSSRRNSVSIFSHPAAHREWLADDTAPGTPLARTPSVHVAPLRISAESRAEDAAEVRRVRRWSKHSNPLAAKTMHDLTSAPSILIAGSPFFMNPNTGCKRIQLLASLSPADPSRDIHGILRSRLRKQRLLAQHLPSQRLARTIYATQRLAYTIHTTQLLARAIHAMQLLARTIHARQLLAHIIHGRRLLVRIIHRALRASRSCPPAVEGWGSFEGGARVFEPVRLRW